MDATVLLVKILIFSYKSPEIENHEATISGPLGADPSEILERIPVAFSDPLNSRVNSCGFLTFPKSCGFSSWSP